ncbi:MGH1-like glycoside hydrolase domain-containing protein [Yoonia sp. R2-816]|uniref:MGH1-like glycoside hydrolase domain-containing protein n=1 Tax=Yoonia sp. R2-816 TaxID=3342638 RepID=UPI00372BA8ED
MTDLDAQARAILRGNDKGGYTLPTHGLYPYQWNWDSAFAAWGFATFDNSRAWDELDTLMASQWDTGMVPHIIFHQPDPGYFPGPDVWGTGQSPATSGISQPPVAATLARLIWDMDPQAGRDRIAVLYPKLVAWHRWWHEVRCTHGPVAIIHPWESGRDNCPDWDIGMAGVDGTRVGPYTRRDTGHVNPDMRPTKEDYDRYITMVEYGRSVDWDQDRIVADGPFLMADPGITFILLRAHDDLAAIGRALGHDVSEIEGWAGALRAALPALWNDKLGAYDAKDLRTDRFAGILGSGAFLAYLADAENPALDTQLMRVWNAVTYGIPSADPESVSFNPRKYWRGPTWPVVNALLALGFKGSGRTDLAERLRSETETLIRQHGFYEYFDPLDATPCGGADFSWTAAIWLTWARHHPDTALKGAA